MRLRLFLILFTLTIFSVASGLGLRIAFAAWNPPSDSPPLGNVPPPINEGGSDQIKTGGLTIGGSFVVGAPTLGAQGAGSINAQKICINGDCLTSWGGGQAFVQDGNTFGKLATLGTIDNFALAFKTNNSEKMRIDATGNVGIGTNNPTVKLQVAGGSLRIGTPTTGDANPFLDLYSTTTVSKIQNISGHLSFGHPGAVEEAMTILPAGNVGIGTTSPYYKLTIAGSAPREYLWPSGNSNPELDFGNQTPDSHWGIYRDNLYSTNDLRFWYGTEAGDGQNNVIMTPAGDIDSLRCFGPVYVGQTTIAHDGAQSGYKNANALCAAAVSGSHVCTTSEILETIKCKPVLPNTGQTWISNGPPGYTARANDCVGWTSNTGSGAEIAYGAIWAWDDKGGIGWVTTCNQTLKFACCK